MFRALALLPQSCQVFSRRDHCPWQDAIARDGAVVSRLVDQAVLVNRKCFGHGDNAVASLIQVEARQFNVYDFSPEVLQHAHGRIHGVEDRWGRSRIAFVEMAYQPNAHAGDAVIETGPVVDYRIVGRAGIERIVAGNDLEHYGTIFHRPGERTRVIETPGKGQDAAFRHASKRRFDPGQAAISGRQPHGTARIGAHGAGGQTRRHRRACTAARTAGKTVEQPGVIGWRPR